MTWLTRIRADENTVDVIPIADEIKHDPSDDCMCGPTTEFVDGPADTGFVCVHHSLDGREASE